MAAEFLQFSGPTNPPTANRASGKATPAKELFGAVTAPAPLVPRAIGTYAKGCLSGGVALPITGPNWQVMRLSRNRNWGRARLVSILERLATDARRLDGWPGLLIGDMAQPRGGPMITGHESHQIGLDADIWLTPMPNRRLDGHLDAEGPVHRRYETSDPFAHEADQACCILSRGRADICASGHQAGAV